MGGPLRFKHEALIERYQMERMDPSDRSLTGRSSSIACLEAM